MRIAYLSSACIPSRTANSIHVVKMSSAFSRAGNEVTLSAPNKTIDREPDVEDVYSYYGVDKSFEVAFGPWVASRGRRYWYGWWASGCAKKTKVELAYGRDLISSLFAAYRGLPVVFEAHRPIEDDGNVANFLFKKLIRNSNFLFLVVITNALREHYDKSWPELSGRIVVAPDGADIPDQYVTPASLGSNKGRLQVGYTGSLYKGKGVELIVAIARISPEMDFHIVGGTSSDLAYWKNNKDTPDNVVFHGHYPHSKILNFLKAFDVVLLPNQPEVHSYGGKENIGSWTSPLKLFEYMASEKPVLCSDVPVLQEIAIHESNALVCRHNVPEDWKKSLQRLAKNANERRKLASEAKKQFLEHYSWDSRARKILSEIKISLS